MNIVTEANYRGQADCRQAAQASGADGALVHHRRAAAVRLLVGGLVWLQFVFRGQMIKQFFEQHAAADQRHRCRGQVRSDSESADRGRRSRRRASGQCHLRCLTAASPTSCSPPAPSVKAGSPLVQLFDAPEQGDLASFKAQATRGAAVAGSRQAARGAPVRPAGDRRYRAGGLSTRPTPASPRPRRSFRRSWCARRSTANSASARSRSASILTAGTQIVTLTDLSTLYANFTVTEKDSRPAQGRPDRTHRGRRLSGPYLRGQDQRDRAADRDRHAQHPRAGDARQSRSASSSPACSRRRRWCCPTSRRSSPFPKPLSTTRSMATRSTSSPRRKTMTARPA